MKEGIVKFGKWTAEFGKRFLYLLSAATFLCVWACGLITVIKAFPPEKDAPHFDTTALMEWCGEPNGTIRMIGAEYLGCGVFEDETGKFWTAGGDYDLDGFYLLWIDNEGLMKIWQER